jgi:hypothetical protein
VAAIKPQHTTINQESTAVVDGMLERRHGRGRACVWGHHPIVLEPCMQEQKVIEMKYIVALDCRQSEIYRTTTNQKWEETMEQSMERRCDQREARVGCCSTVFCKRQVIRK